ncbi:MAG: radical SAM protein [Chloroflexi bacterium]|nr:radical SAM protein [Chloroflexota bacterium]
MSQDVAENPFVPSLISWNLTQQCNLRCPHCYLNATPTPGQRELCPEEALQTVQQIAKLSTGAMLVFSGGEPLLRPDLPDLVRQASSRGLLPVLGTNGTLLTEAKLQHLIACGLAGVGISLDSPTPEYHDAFRGMKGAWRGAIDAVRSCQRVELPFQVQTSLTRENLLYIRPMIELSSQLGAAAFNLFFLVCTGRGEKLSDISPQQYEQALVTLAELQTGFPRMKIRARCAPHFTRFLAQQGAPEAELPTGCMAGNGYLRLTPEGEVTPCPYLPVSLGNLRENELSQILKDSLVLRELQGARWLGRCGACTYSVRCRGCRARAFAVSGNYLGEDPWCTYQPCETEIPPGPSPLPWTDEARQRMERAPRFIRPRVKAYIEAFAREHGYPEITPSVLEEVRQTRPSGKALPFIRPH